MKPEDKKLLSECEIQAFQARGKGGQHLQKTSSAVRLIHHPSGIRVTCQKERSQYLNKKICLEKLRKKLLEKEKKPKKRILTKVPKQIKEEVLKKKQKHSEKKQKRQQIKEWEE